MYLLKYVLHYVSEEARLHFTKRHLDITSLGNDFKQHTIELLQQKAKSYFTMPAFTIDEHSKYILQATYVKAITESSELPTQQEEEDLFITLRMMIQNRLAEISRTLVTSAQRIPSESPGLIELPDY